jgi:hypothetical protein
LIMGAGWWVYGKGLGFRLPAMSTPFDFDSMLTCDHIDNGGRVVGLWQGFRV